MLSCNGEACFEQISSGEGCSRESLWLHIDMEEAPGHTISLSESTTISSCFVLITGGAGGTATAASCSDMLIQAVWDGRNFGAVAKCTDDLADGRYCVVARGRKGAEME